MLCKPPWCTNPGPNWKCDSAQNLWGATRVQGHLISSSSPALLDQANDYLENGKGADRRPRWKSWAHCKALRKAIHTSCWHCPFMLAVWFFVAILQDHAMPDDDDPGFGMKTATCAVWRVERAAAFFSPMLRQAARLPAQAPCRSHSTLSGELACWISG